MDLHGLFAALLGFLKREVIGFSFICNFPRFRILQEEFKSHNFILIYSWSMRVSTFLICVIC